MKIMEKVLFTLLAVLLVSCGDGNTPVSNNGDGPSVSQVRPNANETEVSLDARISVTFDRIIACVSFEEAFSLQDPAKNEVLGIISCNRDLVTMEPFNQLKPSTTYTITIDTALVDSDDVAIATTYSWSFTTTNKAWGSPVKIDNHPPQVVTHQDFVPPLQAATPFDVYDVYGGLTAFAADIDVNDNGTVGVAWSLRPSGGQFYPASGAGPTYGFRQFQPDTGWESEQSISYAYNAFYAFVNPMRPVAGVTSADTLLAAWGHRESQPVKGTNLGNLSILQDSPPQVISNPYAGFSMDSDQLGNAILVYPYVDEASNISVYRYVSGTGWDIGQVLDAQLDRVFSNARVAVNSSGFATVIWIDTTTFSVTTPQESRLCYSHYSPDLDEWTEVDCLAAVPGGFIKHADVGIDDQGNSVAVWSVGSEIFYSIHALDSVLDWKDLPIETVSDDEGSLVQNLQFAMNKSGQVILGWTAYLGGPNSESEGRASSYLPDLDEWTEPVTLFSGQSPSSLHDVDINDQGSALVIYTEGDFSGISGPPYYLLQTTRSVDLIAVPHNPLDGWLTPQIIRSDGAYYNPRIAIDNAGNATAVFSLWEGKDAFFWASRYE